MNPISQINLYGYKNQFEEILKINSLGILPNKLIFSGMQGIGKSTFAFHFINYLFSINEEHSYDLKNFKINNNNKSFNLVQKNIHPNFFIINVKEDKKNIDISQIREMIIFTNKSSFNNQKKIILIDNVENLNLSSLNALLKIIEEPNENTLFILIYNNEKKLAKTLKSRCIEFKFNINEQAVKLIVDSVFNENLYDDITTEIKKYYNSPAVYIDFINLCKKYNLDYKKISIEKIINFIINNKLYKNDKLIKNNLKLYIEFFFRKNIFDIKNYELFNLYNYFNKKFNMINKFNLDYESLALEFNTKLLND